MSRYVLAPGEALDAAFRRVMRKQLRSAGRALATEATPALAIHRARRCLKRSRSLLMLLEPAYRRGRWSDEAKTLRSAANWLAGARDEQAKLDALAKLVTRAGKSLPATALGRVRRSLERRREAHEQAIGPELDAELNRALDRIGQGLRRRHLSRFDDQALADGITLTYRRGRKAMRAAFASGHDEDFHAWRGDVQAHWRHMQLVEGCWPAEIQVRAETAKVLSGLLGDDHDLWLLATEIADPELPIGAADRRYLAKLCQRMQQDLRHEARHVGERLFAERPKQFGKRLLRYWRDASASGENPDRVDADEAVEVTSAVESNVLATTA